MNICKISSITPGKPWESAHGTMYSFTIAFEDGVRGEANAKTNPPPYKVGDKVGYEIAGQTPRGQNKLKIDRKADPAVCKDTTPASHPDLEAAAPTPKPVSAREQAFHGGAAQKPANATETPKNVPLHGATACWAVGKAVEIYIAGSEGWNPQSQIKVEEIARQILDIQQKLEHGEPECPF